jgi:hypothetical protein
MKKNGVLQLALHDAPSNSLKDSNASLKVKTMEEKGVGVRSFVCSTLRVKKVC